MAIHKIMSKDEWATLYKTEPEEAYSYYQATRDITAHIEKIVTQTESFQDLKQEILKFINDRNEFTAFAYTYQGQ